MLLVGLLIRPMPRLLFYKLCSCCAEPLPLAGVAGGNAAAPESAGMCINSGSSKTVIVSVTAQVRPDHYLKFVESSLFGVQTTTRPRLHNFLAFKLGFLGHTESIWPFLWQHHAHRVPPQSQQVMRGLTFKPQWASISTLRLAAGTVTMAPVRVSSSISSSQSGGSTLAAEFGGMAHFKGQTHARLLGAYTITAISRQKLCFTAAVPVCTKPHAAPTRKPSHKPSHKPTHKATRAPVCKPGSAKARNGGCVKCRAGTASADGKLCRKCPSGHYSDETGAKTCIACASSTSSQTFTDDTGTKCWMPVSNAGRTGCGRGFAPLAYSKLYLQAAALCCNHP